ncbi:MAG: hypothetical protein K8S13_05270 [Desulfobacula sp.]|uniref:hypothetical protein n=1 Tax=Desulfobacula sp. TaxID=2593537 RepID=UPI0025BD6941|nr:hypothetical protein [Desulfobacula sp.]MCD4719258.1 hypothetical protein [Desulfobacula sp.]
MRQDFVGLVFGFLVFFSYVTAFSQNIDDVLIDLDLDFKTEEFEKKPYSVNGDIETKETIRFLDRDSLLFKQKYLDNKNDTTAWQTDLDLTIEGKYQKDIIKLYGRFNGLFYYNDDENFESERKAEEFYISFQPSFAWAFDAGKKVHKWGKGYAFSPSAFFSRPKDLNDPDATLEGYYSLSADYIKSMEGILKTFAITPVLVPVTRELNHELGQKDEFIWGTKFYFFAFDSDVDFMFLISDNMEDRFGVDFSKNLSPSFEIHGDVALVKDYHQYIIDDYGNISEQEYTAFNLLLGLRYLSSQDTTYILEYYRNGQGYSGREYENYLSFIERGFDQYLNTSSKALISKSKTYAAYYNQQAAMKDYLYLKISQKEPFDILYFVPTIIFIYNMDDQSASITPQITYSPLTNLTLEIKTSFLIGGSKTEYGEKINKAKIVLAIQYYF